MSIGNRIGFADFMDAMNIMPMPLEVSQSLTTAEILQKLYGYMKDVSEKADSVNAEIYKEFSKKFDELAMSSFTTVYPNFIKEMKAYCLNYISELIGDTLKYITFGLTDDGYFCATIPEEWADLIEFDTVFEPSSDDYGKLIIMY